MEITFKSVFPNPTMYDLNISIYSPIDQEVDIQIFDSRGALSQTFKMDLGKGENMKEISIEDLSGGFYSIYIPQAQVKNSTLRFVKLRD